MSGLCSRGESLPGPEVLGPCVPRVCSLSNCGVQVASTCLFGVSFSLPGTRVRRSFPLGAPRPELGMCTPGIGFALCPCLGTFSVIRM